VVLYTSQDTGYLEGCFAPFSEATGITVKAVGDTEATKTRGLKARLLEEQSRPRADVFWNNEFGNTVHLAQAGVLAPYESPAAADLPAAYCDPGHRWTGFAARLRVFIVNTERLGDRAPPTGWDDYLDPAWQGETVLAKPLAGTTLTHLTSYLVREGEDQLIALLQGLRDHGVAIADGNAHVMRLVSRGEYTWGLTDTDDLHLALLQGDPVVAAWPVPAAAMVIPSTVALIQGAPHPEEARALIDFLLSAAMEQRLAAGKSAQFPLRPELPGPPAFGQLSQHYPLDQPPAFDDIGARLEHVAALVEKHLLGP
jgi:iron(III) transport system substrate-binding protein